MSIKIPSPAFRHAAIGPAGARPLTATAAAFPLHYHHAAYRASSLLQAAKLGKVNDLRASLDAGTEIKSKDSNDRTALWWAAYSGNVDCLKLLIEGGADVNAADKNGLTPVHKASQSGNADALGVIIKAGGVVHAISKYGENPLHWAAATGKTACATVLMEAGARRDIKNKDGKTAAQLADTQHKTETAAAIRAFKLKVNPRLQRAMQWRRAMEAKRDAGMVFQAASEGRPLELAKRLRLGRLAGAMNTKGMTPAMPFPVLPIEAATINGHDECVQILTERGSPVPSAPFWQFWLGLTVFSHSRDGQIQELNKFLFSRNVPGIVLSTRQSLETGQYVLPIEAAALMGHRECVAALRYAGSPDIGPGYNQLLEQFKRLDAAGSKGMIREGEGLGGSSAYGAATRARPCMAWSEHVQLPDGWGEGSMGGRVIYVHPASGRMQFDRPT